MNQFSVQDNNNEIAPLIDQICNGDEAYGTKIVVLLRAEDQKKEVCSSVLDKVLVIEDEEKFFDIHEKITKLQDSVIEDLDSSSALEIKYPLRIVLKNPREWKCFEQVERLLYQLHNFIVFILDSYTNAQTLYLADKSYVVDQKGWIETEVHSWV